jgi:hypothetical protein
MDKKQRAEELKQQLERIQQEIDIIDQFDDMIRLLSDFTDEEKIAVFDELYAKAYKYLQETVEDGREPKDCDHYMMEAVLLSCLGENVWKVINAVQR